MSAFDAGNRRVIKHLAFPLRKYRKVNWQKKNTDEYLKNWSFYIINITDLFFKKSSMAFIRVNIGRVDSSSFSHKSSSVVDGLSQWNIIIFYYFPFVINLNFFLRFFTRTGRCHFFMIIWRTGLKLNMRKEMFFFLPFWIS